MEQERALYNAREAATLLSVSLQTLYTMVRMGALGHIRRDTPKGAARIYVPKQEIDDYVKQHVVYGYKVDLSPARKETLEKALAKARETRASNAKRRKRKEMGYQPLENVEGTIYVLGLKARTFNVLCRNNLLTLDAVNINDPTIAKQLMGIRGFGLVCWQDLRAKLDKYNLEVLEKEQMG